MAHIDKQQMEGEILMSYRDLKSAISSISKRKPIPAIVIDVLGKRCSVRLSGNGGKLTNLPFSGGVPYLNQNVYVDYSRGYPFVSIADSLPQIIEPVIATNRPVSSAVKSPASNSIEKQPTRYGNLLYRDDWDVETAYLSNDLVSYMSTIYLCVSDSIGNLPTDSAYWTPLGSGETSNYVTNEIVTGERDGNNLYFSLSQIPVLNSLQLFLNGVLLTYGVDGDYVIDGLSITMMEFCAPEVLDTFTAFYRY